jgi:hypothetical protein
MNTNKAGIYHKATKDTKREDRKNSRKAAKIQSREKSTDYADSRGNVVTTESGLTGSRCWECSLAGTADYKGDERLLSNDQTTTGAGKYVAMDITFSNWLTS